MSATNDQSSDKHDASSVDNEHRIQLGMLKALCDAVEAGEPAEKVHEILSQLTAYSELHFMSEELLMRMYSYPDYDDHVLDHEAMTERLKQITQRYSEGKESMALQTAIEMLEFLLGHINSRDQALSDFLVTTQS